MKRKPADALGDILVYIDRLRGCANAVTFAQVVHDLDLEDGRNEPETRAAVLTWIERGEPITTCRKGVFYPETLEEKREYLDSLYGRRAGLDRRIKAYERAAGLA